MKRLLIIYSALLLSSCTTPQTQETDKNEVLKETTSITLTETHLNNIKLNDLNETNVSLKLRNTFPNLTVTKEIGHQDGPDFNVYLVSDSDKDIFFVKMNSDDSTIVDEIYFETTNIKDQYNIEIGHTAQDILKRRPTIQFYSDLHYNVHGSVPNSKILYRFFGDFKSLNDSTFTHDDFSMESWQVENMTLEYIIWRK